LNEKVLYMEDDPTQARLVKKCLERAGFVVEWAGDGHEGLAAWEAQPKAYEALIVDQTMPGLSGLEVLRAIAAHGELPPTVMVTGTGNEHIAVEAMKLGVSDYLVKDLEGGFVNVLPLAVSRAIEQHRLRAEKRQMESELARAQRLEAVGRLAAGIAHEINTPTQYLGDNARFLQDAFQELCGLITELERLVRAARENQLHESLLEEIEAKIRAADLDFLSREIPLALRQTLEGIEHVSGIVAAMKEFAHPANGQKQAVDLNHIILGALTLCRSEWKYVAEVETDLDPELPPVSCFPTDLNRVIMNLVLNAAQAIAEKAQQSGGEYQGRIIIRTRYEHPWVEIRVEDNGIGIPPEIQSHVFDLFFTTKKIGQGSGQGLAIAHTIVVDKHGGTINFQSTPGEKTVFVVRLPVGEQLVIDRAASDVAAATV